MRSSDRRRCSGPRHPLPARGGPLLATVVFLVAALVAPATAQDAATPDEGRGAVPPEFTQALPIPTTVQLTGGATDQRVIIGVHRWRARGGDRPPSRFTLSIAAAPPFLENVRFPDGASLEFAEEEDRKEVVVAFDVATSAAVTEAELIVVVHAEDEALEPRDRRLALPMELDGEDPWGTARGVVCALGAEAPADLRPEDVLEHCDSSREPPLVWDRTAVFFTPGRPLPEAGTRGAEEIVLWRILNPNGRVVASGDNWESGAREDGAGETTRLPDDLPGAFLALLDPRSRGDDPDPAEARRGPGTYTVQTAPGKLDASHHLLGQGPLRIVDDGEWVDEMTFEVEDAKLRFRDFVTEEVSELNLPRIPGIWAGTWSVGIPQEREDGSVELELTARYRRTVTERTPVDPALPGLGNVERDRPEEAIQRVRSLLRLDLPEQLDPGAREMGVVRFRLEPLDVGPGVDDREIFFTAGMHRLVPTGRQPPDRFLVQGETPTPFGLDSEYTVEVDSGDGTWVWDQTLPYVEQEDSHIYRYSWARSITGSAVVPNARPEEPSGLPSRPLAGHLHDPETIWVVPVVLRLTDSAETHGASFRTRAFGYAVYTTERGSYDGTRPTDAPPSGPPPPDPPDDAPSEEDNSDPPGSDTEIDDHGAPDTQGGDGDSGESDGDGDPGPGDSGWDDDADGPEGDDPDRDGATGVDDDPPGDDPTGEGGGPEGEDPPGGPDGIDPSAPEVARLIRRWLSTAEPPPNATDGADFTYNQRGTMVGTTRDGSIMRAPHDEGLPFSPVFLWEQRRTLDSVDHCTMEEFVRANLQGSSTDHCVGRYERLRVVTTPDVSGRKAQEARRILQGEGFRVEVAIAAEAGSEEQEYTVLEQDPAPGAEIEPQGLVRLQIYGEFAPRATVPYISGSTLAEARRRLREAGLRVRAIEVGPADRPGAVQRVVSADPIGGTEVDAGSEVEVRYLGEFADPRCAELVRQGRAERAATNWVRALELLREAASLECPDPGLKDDIVTLEEAVRNRCDGLVEQGNLHLTLGDAAAAMATFLRARDMGCTDPRIDAGIDSVEETIDRESRCRRLVDQGNSARSRGELQAALSAYREAREQGCTNTGLGEAIAEIEDRITRTRTERTRPEDGPAEPGYYVYRKSGSGYDRRGNRSFRITGHHIGVIRLQEGVDRVRTVYGWIQVPASTSPRELFEGWRDSALETTRNQCGSEVGVSMGRRSPDPEIWTTGPEYTLLAGPFGSSSEAREAYGCDNQRLRAGVICSRWEAQTRELSEAHAACRRMGYR